MKILHIPSGQFMKFYTLDKNGCETVTEIVEEANNAKTFLKANKNSKTALLNRVLDDFEKSETYQSVKKLNGLDPNECYQRFEFKVYWRKDNVS